MTAAQIHPLPSTVDIDGAVRLTPRQRAWLHALTMSADRRDRPRRVTVEPADSSRYDLVVFAYWGASRDHEYAVWTLHSTGTADIW